MFLCKNLFCWRVFSLALSGWVGLLGGYGVVKVLVVDDLVLVGGLL